MHENFEFGLVLLVRQSKIQNGKRREMSGVVVMTSRRLWGRIS
jgi:hypothetical protein